MELLEAFSMAASETVAAARKAVRKGKTLDLDPELPRAPLLLEAFSMAASETVAAARKAVRKGKTLDLDPERPHVHGCVFRHPVGGDEAGEPKRRQ
jgi:hypothetical protein